MFISISSKRTSLVLSLLSAIGFICAAFFIYQYITTKRRIADIAYAQSQKRTLETAQQLNSFIEMLKPLVNNLTQKLNTENLSTDQIKKILMEKPVEITGFGIAFKNKSESFYFVEKEDKQIVTQLEKIIDYTQPEHNWFQQPLEQKKSVFVGPYTDPATSEQVIAYAAPFYQKNNPHEPAGVVFATQSLDHINHVLSTLYLGQSGYWFITEPSGTLIYHPMNIRVTRHQSVQDIADEINSSALKNAVQETHEKKIGFTSYNNEITGNPSWLFFAPITSIGWTLFGVFDTYELPLNPNMMRKQLMNIVIALLLALIFLILSLALRNHITPKKLWITSALVSITLCGALSGLWNIRVRYPASDKNLIEIRDKVSLYKFLDNYGSVNIASTEQLTKLETPESMSEEQYYLRYRYKQGRYIPTGVLINDIKFVSEDQVEIVCLVWQRYFEGIHDTVARGFLLPQMADKPDIIEIGRSKKEKHETILWQVRATLNQNLSYRFYPFDVKNIQLQFWHKDFEQQIILVPDLDAYQIINPAALPGINQSNHLIGWYLTESMFGYKINHYRTNFGFYSYGPFGIYEEVERPNIPELHFMVSAQRSLFEVVTTDIVALLVISIILFVLLLTYSQQGIGWTLATCTTGFFSTILSQLRFRDKIPTYGLVYFETFYFLIYIVILLILITALLHLFKIKIRWIEYHNNIITKISYWPIIFGTMLCATLWYLY